MEENASKLFFLLWTIYTSMEGDTSSKQDENIGPKQTELKKGKQQSKRSIK